MRYINGLNINRRENKFDNKQNLRICNSHNKKELTIVLNEIWSFDVVS